MARSHASKKTFRKSPATTSKKTAKGRRSTDAMAAGARKKSTVSRKTKVAAPAVAPDEGPARKVPARKKKTALAGAAPQTPRTGAAGRKKAPAKKPSHRFPKATSRPTRKTHRKPAADLPPPSTETNQRLQRVLAAAGYGSRRSCEELITAGRVEIDRQVVTELGTRVDPSRQEVRVDGEVLRRPKPVYVALNKPKGVVCTNRDPQGRPRAVDLVSERYGRLFPVGRLDLHSEGLLLLTNDGALANRLTHPRYGIQKVYRVQVAGNVTREVLEQIQRGVYLAEGVARVTDVRIHGRHKNSTILEMILDEGKNREIRRVFARVGHKVLMLVRIAVGPVRLAQMAPGESRRLTPREVGELRKAVRMAGPRRAETKEGETS